ncbi:hypothetical protein HYW54_02460 [Candidatus Gottesmanbacteria bacterium]|nr:hypothetical protein [Candidatus Gottesmanbacteria bacterium]
MAADDKYKNISAPTEETEEESNEEESGVEQDLKNILHTAPSLAVFAKHDKEAYAILDEARHNLTEIASNPTYREQVRHALNHLDTFAGINSRLGDPELYRQIKTTLYAADKIAKGAEKSPEYESIRQRLKEINEQEKGARERNEPTERFGRDRATVLAEKDVLDSKVFIRETIGQSLPEEIRKSIQNLPEGQISPLEGLSERIYNGERLQPKDIESALGGKVNLSTLTPQQQQSLNEGLNLSVQYADEHHLFKQVKETLNEDPLSKTNTEIAETREKQRDGSVTKEELDEYKKLLRQRASLLSGKKPTTPTPTPPEIPTPPVLPEIPLAPATIPPPPPAIPTSPPPFPTPGFLKNITSSFANISNGLKSIIGGIGKIFGGALGSIIKGALGKIIALAGGPVGLAIALGLSILTKLPLIGPLIEKAIKIITQIIILTVIGALLLVIILIFILFIKPVIDFACSVPVIGCGSIDIINQLPIP